MKEQPELKVHEVPTGDLVPYANNAKLHSELQVEQIANSIKEFGFNDPIAVWESPDGKMEVVEGHGRVMAAQRLGMGKVPVIYLNHLSDDARRAYTHVHNQTTLNSGFDMDVLTADLEELAESLDVDFADFGFDAEEDDAAGLSDEYSQNVGSVVYEPNETDHKVSDLYSYDEGRFSDALSRIENDELREMLRLRAAWFAEFDFARIADYYAYQATSEEQRAFEAMGLVLLDRDQLIENGFADMLEFIDRGGAAE